jgi:hypothetical protein
MSTLALLRICALCAMLELGEIVALALAPICGSNRFA